MAILLIDKIKQKNNGTFKLMDAIDINWDGFSVPVDSIDAYTKEQTDNLIEASKYDDTTVKASIKANADAINILNGTGTGSVDKKVADAVANLINGAPEAYDTLKEISDWISSHGTDAAAMNSQINTNKEDIAKLVSLVGSLPVSTEAKTIVEYIDEQVGAIDYSDAIATAKQEAIDAAAADATAKANTAETNAKAYADSLAPNYATAAQGAKADTALQSADITEGATNGTIAVKGIDVDVHGLGTAAYVGTETFDAAGSAENALKEAKAYADSKVDGVDLSGIATNAEAIEDLKTRATTAEGKLDIIQGVGEGSIAKAVADAKTELEGKIKTNTDAIGVLNGSGDGSVAKAVSTAKAALQGQIDANKEVLDKLDGAVSVDGSIKKQIADAKQALEQEITDSMYDDTALTARVAANENSLGTLNGADTVTGSVAKQVKDARTAIENTIGTVAENKTVVEMIKDAQTAATYDDSEVKASIKSNTDAITILNGTGVGSVDKKVADAIAAIVANAPESFDTLKEIADWIDGHASDASEMNTNIKANKAEIDKLVALVGALPEGESSKTIVEYIDKKVGAVDFSDAIATAKQEAITASNTHADELNTAMDGRMTTAEGKITSIETSLADGGTTEKAIAAAKKAGDDAQADVDALTIRVETLEGTTYVAITDTEIEGLFAE